MRRASDLGGSASFSESASRVPRTGVRRPRLHSAAQGHKTHKYMEYTGEYFVEWRDAANDSGSGYRPYAWRYMMRAVSESRQTVRGQREWITRRCHCG